MTPGTRSVASSHGEQRGPRSFLPIHLDSQALQKSCRKIWFLHRGSDCCIDPAANQHGAAPPLIYSILLGAARPPPSVRWKGSDLGMISGFPSYPEGWLGAKSYRKKILDWDRMGLGLSGRTQRKRLRLWHLKDCKTLQFHQTPRLTTCP